MNLQDAKALAELLLEEHGLDRQGWTFEWHASKRTAGRCNYSAKLISLSHSYTGLNEERFVENTLRHEVAHALVGPGHGHGPVWRRQAVTIGCDGNRCTSPETVRATGKYTLTCSACGQAYQMARRPADQKGCGRCYRGSGQQLERRTIYPLRLRASAS